MAFHNYATSEGRVNEIKGKMLGHAVPFECLAQGVTQEEMPTNKGDNMTYRRRRPYGAAATNDNTKNRWSLTAAAHVVSEGVTPNADTLTFDDVNVVIQQYGCLYAYTDKAKKLHEDDIPKEMIEQTGERAGLIKEMILYGELKSCTNVSYCGGTTRLTVDEAIKLNFLRNIAKTLMLNGAKMVNRVISASPSYDTSAIEPGYMVFHSTDLSHDVRDLPGFVPVAKYANPASALPGEYGSCEDFRFIRSKELVPYTDAGATAAGTGLVTSGTKVDVYPIIVMAKEAAYDVALRGESAIDPIHVPCNQRDKSDPGGQRGYVGAFFWSAAKVVNNGWMAVGEVGCTDISG